MPSIFVKFTVGILLIVPVVLLAMVFMSDTQDEKTAQSPEAAQSTTSGLPPSLSPSRGFAGATVSSSGLLVLDLPFLFRTMMIGPKPKSFFHVLSDVDSVHHHEPLRKLNGIFQVRKRNYEKYGPRVPVVEFSQENTPTLSTESNRLYEAAFVINVETCFENAWHGVNDVIMSLLGAKVVYALADMGNFDSIRNPTEFLADRVVDRLIDDVKSQRHVLLAQAPRKNIWGQYNTGCPPMNLYPYGISPTSPGGWIASALFNRFFVEGDELVDSTEAHHSNVLFFGETPGNRNYNSTTYGRERVIAVKRHFVLGSTSLCSLHLDVFPLTVKWPYYISNASFCPWIYDVLKKYILRTLSLSHLDTPVTEEELRCPHVVIISRATQVNGRGLKNEKAVTDAIQKFVDDGGPLLDGKKMFTCGRVTVVKLEKLGSIRRQINMILNATILIGTRGMGLLYGSVFLRNRAGLLAISGREKAAPTSVVNDNFAWYPLRHAKPSVPCVLSSCDVVFPKSDSTPFAAKCLKRTINFCDVFCRPAQVVKDFTKLVMMTLGAVRRNMDQAVYLDEDMDNFLVIPK